MSMALHILRGHQNVVGRQLVPIYMRRPPTHYYLEYSGRRPTWKLTLLALMVGRDWNPRPRGVADAATWASDTRPHRQGGVACDTQRQVDAVASASGCALLRPVAVGRWEFRSPAVTLSCVRLRHPAGGWPSPSFT